MNFRYRLSDVFINTISSFEEYANGAMQVTMLLKDGREFPGILISDATYVIAIRGFKNLPFDLAEIYDIFQIPSDKSPKERGEWQYWDDWEN